MQQNQFSHVTPESLYFDSYKLLGLSVPLSSLLQQRLTSPLEQIAQQIAYRVIPFTDNYKKVASKFEIECSVSQETVQKMTTQKQRLQEKVKALEFAIAKSEERYNNKPEPAREEAGQQIGKTKDFVQDNRKVTKRLTEMRSRVERLKQAQKIRKQEQLMKALAQAQKQKRQASSQKRQQIQRRIDRLKEDEQRRLREWKQSSNKVKQLKGKEKELTEEKAIKQLEKLVLQEQSLRKKILEERREAMHIPMDSQQWEQHAQKYEELLSQKEQLRRNKRRQRLREIRENNQKFQFWADGQQKKYQQSAQKQYLQRRKKYSESIRKQFRPRLDPAKLSEVRSRITSKSLSSSLDPTLKTQLGNKYLKQLPAILQALPKRETQPQNITKSAPRYKNYLSPRTRATNQSHTNRSQWTGILQVEDPTEKAVKVFFNSRKVEARLELREQLARQRHVIDTGIDDQYCEMIKAQVQALKALT